MEERRKVWEEVGLAALLVGTILGISAVGAYAFNTILRENKTPLSIPVEASYKVIYNSR
jgi:hypothetical protein